MLSINLEALKIDPNLLDAIKFSVFVAVDGENNPPRIPRISLLFQERLWVVLWADSSSDIHEYVLPRITIAALSTGLEYPRVKKGRRSTDFSLLLCSQ